MPAWCLGGGESWDQVAQDLRPVYTAVTEAEAKARFTEFAEKPVRAEAILAARGVTSELALERRAYAG